MFISSNTFQKIAKNKNLIFINQREVKQVSLGEKTRSILAELVISLGL